MNRISLDRIIIIVAQIVTIVWVIFRPEYGGIAFLSSIVLLGTHLLLSRLEKNWKA